LKLPRLQPATLTETSPPARGRGLKRDLHGQFGTDLCRRPPRGGVD